MRNPPFFKLTMTNLVALCLSAQINSGPHSFDVASVKMAAIGCADAGTGSDLRFSQGRIVLHCVQTRAIARFAYSGVAVGDIRRGIPIIGGPAWIDSDRYDIEAKADGASPAELSGLLLQRLLEDRFHLRVHKEPRNTPVYLLAAGARQLRLRPADSSACVVRNTSEFPPARGTAVSNYCGGGDFKGTRQNRIVDLYSVDLTAFAAFLSNYVDRPVVDGTGITGKYDIHLEFAREESSSGLMTINGVAASATVQDASTSASIFTALQQQTGLKLTQGTAPLDFIVVDNVERPTEN